ncbi:hypothetical protein K488DRAFT_68985 [Vararia minispora EC-137]|uniref:Uncharacterized protein n=1 Tax=Vararia minispora EC-137 TaxID=1314806 RepID=A0ACB8QSX3_9AGAM|nr:hypothetical protein K488DRAFT_68985 [Vararia minispora EC-137]
MPNSPKELTEIFAEAFGPFDEAEAIKPPRKGTRRKPLNLHGFIMSCGGHITGLDHTEQQYAQGMLDVPSLALKGADLPSLELHGHSIRFRGTLILGADELSHLQPDALATIGRQYRDRLRSNTITPVFKDISHLMKRYGDIRIHLQITGTKTWPATYLRSTEYPDALIIRAIGESTVLSSEKPSSE